MVCSGRGLNCEVIGRPGAGPETGDLASETNKAGSVETRCGGHRVRTRSAREAKEGHAAGCYDS